MGLQPLAAKSGTVLGALAQGAAPSWVTPTDIPPGEADALKLLYDLTDGDNWNTNTNWGLTATANDWFGVTVAGGVVTIISLINNALDGNAATWQPGDFAGLLVLELRVNPNLAGSVSAWDFSSLTSLTNIRIHVTALSGDLNPWGALPATLVNLRVRNTSISGAPDLSLAVALADFQYQDCSLSQADVDANLQAIYDNRADFTNATPALNIGGTNSAPSGVYQDATPPTTGKEYIFKLENDPDTEGFNKWTITYTA